MKQKSEETINSIILEEYEFDFVTDIEMDMKVTN